MEEMKKRAEDERGFIYDPSGGTYLPVVSYVRGESGTNYRLTCVNGRQRVVELTHWLFYSKEILDFLPVPA